jgi:dTDP-4-amino-4,6-dideoxygalactose transaminase
LEGQIGTAQEVVKADSVAVFIDTTETMAVVDTTSIQKKLTRKEKWQKRWAQFHFFRKK